MTLKELLRILLKNKDAKFGIISFSASLLTFIIPFLIALVIIFTMFSGILGIIIEPTYVYIIQNIIFGLIVPLIIIFIIMLGLKLFVTFTRLDIYSSIKNYCVQNKGKAFKGMIIILISVVFCIFYLFKINQKTINVICDIPNAINHEYNYMDGVVTIYSDTDIPYVKVDNVEFSEGFYHKPGVIDGKKYRVEYLPNSRYIVDFKPIE